MNALSGNTNVQKKLVIQTQTWAKPTTDQSSELDGSTLIACKPKTEFDLESFDLADAGHIKVVLKEAIAPKTGTGKGQKQGNASKTKYFYGAHVEVLEAVSDGKEEPTITWLPVFPEEEQATQIEIYFPETTVIKREMLPSGRLPLSKKDTIQGGTTIRVSSFEICDSPYGEHVRFVIADPNAFRKGCAIWYAFVKHVVITQGEEKLLPGLEPPRYIPEKLHFKGAQMTLPNGKTVYLNQPIIPNGNFLWREATHGGTREPKTQDDADNIIALAAPLQKARDQIGRPFRVTSWYRPEPHNSRVGGARRSQHLSGRAVDLVVEGYMGIDLAKAFWPWWPGGVGIYGGNRRHIIHLDIGPKRKWGF